MATSIGTEDGEELAMLAAGDTLIGRGGNDLLLATFAIGDLRGGTGDDRFIAEGTGGHTMTGAAGDDTFDFTGSSGNRATGGEGRDTFTLTGGSNDNVLSGGGGGRPLPSRLVERHHRIGWPGKRLRSTAICTADGGAGDDFLFVDGNLFSNTLTGGAGRDTFSLGFAREITITDLTRTGQAQDWLDVSVVFESRYTL